MSNNQLNSECGFAEDLVSYLYGEIDSASKTKFEKHLDKCSTCDDELAAFGYVRSSILDWREDEFAKLETPEIKVLAFEDLRTVVTSNNSTVSRSWFDGLRQIFSLSPAWTATAAFAALAVFFGLGIVFYNFSNSSDLAEKTNEQNSIKNNDSIEKPVKLVISEIKDSENEELKEDQPEPSLARKEIPEINLKEVNKDKNLQEKTIVKFAEKTPKVKKQIKEKKPSETTIAVRDSDNSTNNKETTVYQNAPKLSNLAEEDDDDSLRLADLFDEVGS